ncbi:aspartyl-phosphate phosphatase Spo0E family protein [Clostridium cylindrosporum]|uniref:aspartyl-phosphate phosphatase Spo0E family protein n=1 Tax=Clostridium cylindrosporum TaxID=1495 RepID=UPI001FA6DB3D|nr:aspartyl-phosphate phosphatase Spo0E family protein [Clostridium cylindrosporum]
MFVLSEVEDLLKDVEILRKKLLYLIDKKQGDLVDEEIVNLSKVLNAALNQYNKVLEEKLNQ